MSGKECGARDSSIWGDIGRLQYLIGAGQAERALAVLDYIKADLRIRLAVPWSKGYGCGCLIPDKTPSKASDECPEHHEPIIACGYINEVDLRRAIETGDVA